MIKDTYNNILILSSYHPQKKHNNFIVQLPKGKRRRVGGFLGVPVGDDCTVHRGNDQANKKTALKALKICLLLFFYTLDTTLVRQPSININQIVKLCLLSSFEHFYPQV